MRHYAVVNNIHEQEATIIFRDADDPPNTWYSMETVKSQEHAQDIVEALNHHYLES